MLISFLIYSCNKSNEEHKNNDKINEESIGQIRNTKIPQDKYKFVNDADTEGMILAYKDDKQGYIDKNDKVLIPFIYEYLGVFSKNCLAPAKQNDKWGYINRKGDVKISFKYSGAGYFYASGLAIVDRNTKSGFVDKEGVEVIPCIYEEVKQSTLDSIVIVKKKNKWAFFNNKGKQLTLFQFDEVYESHSLGIEGRQSSFFAGGLALVIKNNKFGFLNGNLQIVIPFGKYDSAGTLNENGFGIIVKSGKYGVINHLAEEIIAPNNQSIEKPEQYGNILDVFFVKKRNTFEVYNSEIKPITKTSILTYQWNKVIENGKANDILILQDVNRLYGVIDKKGNIRIPFEYDLIHEFNGKDNTFIVKKKGKFGLVSIQHKTLLPIEYDTISREMFSTYTVIIGKNKKYGIAKTNGNISTKLIYDQLVPIYYDSENLFIARLGKKKGIITANNHIILPLEYDNISNWVENGPEGHFVEKNGHYGLVSKQGQVLLPLIYDEEIEYIHDSLIIVSKNKKVGVVSIQNKNIIPIEYDELNVYGYDAYYKNESPDIYVRKEEKYYVIDKFNHPKNKQPPVKLIKEKLNKATTFEEPALKIK